MDTRTATRFVLRKDHLLPSKKGKVTGPEHPSRSMERMQQHMARMHEMMERLIVQQELMKKASANM